MGKFRRNLTNGSLWMEGLYSDIERFDLFGNQNEFHVAVLGKEKTSTKNLLVRGRILDPRMAHQTYLTDPCDSSTAPNPKRNEAIKSLHTLISIKQADDISESFDEGDIIIVSLGPGENGDKYDLQNARFVKVFQKNTAAPKTSISCVSLTSLPFSSAGAPLTSPTPSSPLVNTTPKGEIYFGQWNVGASPPGFWPAFSEKFQDHVNNLYPELGLKQANLGATRALAASAHASHSGRVSGSKHGLALAKDHFLHVYGPAGVLLLPAVQPNRTVAGEFTGYAFDNPLLAKDQKFVDAILDFMATDNTIMGINVKTDMLWGGTFGRHGATMSKGEPPVGRGIEEFHHFEIKDALVPKFMDPYRTQLAQLDPPFKPEDLTNLSALKSLYLALIK
jgi:hypothetical protein